MRSDLMNRFLRIAEKTGNPLIVTNESGTEGKVILSFSAYEALVLKEEKITGSKKMTGPVFSEKNENKDFFYNQNPDDFFEKKDLQKIDASLEDGAYEISRGADLFENKNMIQEHPRTQINFIKNPDLQEEVQLGFEEKGGQESGAAWYSTKSILERKLREKIIEKANGGAMSEPSVPDISGSGLRAPDSEDDGTEPIFYEEPIV